MTSEASLRIELCNPEEADQLLSSIEPDNKPLPEGLNITTYIDGSSLVICISCKRSTESLLATLDDLMVAIGLAERITCTRALKDSSRRAKAGSPWR